MRVLTQKMANYALKRVILRRIRIYGPKRQQYKEIPISELARIKTLWWVSDVVRRGEQREWKGPKRAAAPLERERERKNEKTTIVFYLILKIKHIRCNFRRGKLPRE